MKNNNVIEELYDQFETVCKVYSDESIGVSLYDKDGYHIISRDNKKTCVTCTFNQSCPKKNSNLFSNENTSPELREIVDRDGVAYFEKNIISNASSDNSEENIVLINIKLVSIQNKKKEIIGYFSLNNDRALFDNNRKLLLDMARDKMANSLSLNNILSWSFDITSPIISFLDKGKIYRYKRMDFEANIHPDDLKASLKYIDDMAKGIRIENNHIIRFKYFGCDEYRYYESKSRVMLDSDKKAKSIIGTYRDITEEYLRQQKTKDTQEVLSNILAESAIMVWDYELSTETTRIYNDSVFLKKMEYNQITHDSQKNISIDDLNNLKQAYASIAKGESEKEDLIIHFKTSDNNVRIAKCHLTYRKNDINIITHIVGCLIDITAQLERERKEKEKNVMFDLILRTEGSNAWYYKIDEGVLHVVLGEDTLGTDGKTIEQISHMMSPKSFKECLDLFDKISKGEIKSSSTILKFIDESDGSVRYIRNAFVATFDENGKANTIIGSHKDVTEEESKRKNLIRYQINSDIVNKVAQIIYWEYDLSTKLIHTRGSKHNEGKPMDEDTFLSYIYPEDRHLISECTKVMDSMADEIEPFEVRCHLPQYNHYRWVKFYISPIRNNGRIISYTGIRCDINDEYINKQNLERLNAQINQVMYMSDIIPFIWKPVYDEFYFTSNVAIKQENNNFSKPGTPLNFKYILSNIHPNDRKQIIDIYNKIISHAQESGWCKIRYDVNHKFERTYNVSILPDKTCKEERTFVGYLQDITNHELLTRRLVDEKLKAQESEKLKSNFLANMSHEIRTPLNAIVGFSSLLSDAESKEEMEAYSDIIQKNSDMLLQLINEIIEISRIDAGRTERYPQKFSLNDLFKENYTMQKELVKLPEVEIKLDIPETELIVNLDRRRTTELLNNFMSNASKYTKEGHIKMGFNVINDKRVRLFVEDTGCGIAEENKIKIFGRFEKLNSFVQGAGLGMSICQHYVKDAGGNIWVDSQIGKGSTFYVELNYI